MKWLDNLIARKVAKKMLNNSFLKLFIGNESKKRYLAAAYVAIRGAYEALVYHGIVTFIWPHWVDTMAAALGVWATGDAIKKLEPK